MPRQRGKLLSDDKCYNLEDWEMLDDESTIDLVKTLTEDTASMTSCGSTTFATDVSIPSARCIVSDSESVSVASQATVTTNPSRSTAPKESPPTALQETLEAITRATIGLKATKADGAEVPVSL